MKRREFIQQAGPVAAGIGLLPSAALASSRQEVVTAAELNAFLRSLVEVDEPSVDRIIMGDPETRISRIGTAWMPYWKTLKEARSRGVNTLVVHEPTFYTHLDLEATRGDYLSAPSTARDAYLKQVELKKAWIERNQMAIIRCHDVLDKISGYGIPFAFGRALGFRDEDIIRSKTYYNVYRIDPKPAVEVAREIASRLGPVGQPGVAFYGNEDFPVQTVGLGTGCICDPLQFMDLEMDLAIAIDDSVSTWTQTTYSADTGRPLVIVNHGTSEEYGMRELAGQLRGFLPGLEILHFDQGCTYQWITS